MEIITEKLYYSKPLFAPLKATVTVYIGSQYLILVDAGSCQKHVQEIKQAIAQISSLPVKYIILTHSHYDHVYGHDSFPGSTIIISSKTQDILKLKDKEMIIVEDYYALIVDGNLIKISHTPSSHSDDLISVHFKNEDTLVVSDSLQSYLNPDNKFEFYDKETVELINYLNSINPRYIVTGHQGLMDREEYTTYLKKLDFARLTVLNCNYDLAQVEEHYIKITKQKHSRLDYYFINGFILGHKNMK